MNSNYDDDDATDEPLSQQDIEMISATKRREFLPEQLDMLLASVARMLDETPPDTEEYRELDVSRNQLVERIMLVGIVTRELEQQWAMPATHER